MESGRDGGVSEMRHGRSSGWDHWHLDATGGQFAGRVGPDDLGGVDCWFGRLGLWRLDRLCAHEPDGAALAWCARQTVGEDSVRAGSSLFVDVVGQSSSSDAVPVGKDLHLTLSSRYGMFGELVREYLVGKEVFQVMALALSGPQERTFVVTSAAGVVELGELDYGMFFAFRRVRGGETGDEQGNGSELGPALVEVHDQSGGHKSVRP